MTDSCTAIVESVGIGSAIGGQAWQSSDPVLRWAFFRLALIYGFVAICGFRACNEPAGRENGSTRRPSSRPRGQNTEVHTEARELFLMFEALLVARKRNE